MAEARELYLQTKNKMSNRDYNIISCVNNQRAQSQISLPPLRKLGQTQDFRRPIYEKVDIVSDQKLSLHQNTVPVVFKKPASLMNASSVDFNFLSLTNHEKQPLKQMKSDQPQLTHKLKGGLGESADIGSIAYTNFNKEFQDTFKQNETVFRRQKGLWPAVQDVKYTYGPFMKPFKKYKF